MALEIKMSIVHFSMIVYPFTGIRSDWAEIKQTSNFFFGSDNIGQNFLEAKVFLEAKIC